MRRKKPALGILVQDLYGRGIAETGAATGMSAALIGAVESRTLRSCDGISVIHGGFARDLVGDFNIATDRIREIRNWTHVTRPNPAISTDFRRAQGWAPDELIILHAGNMGYKQGLENVVRAAALASERKSRVRFVLMGDGNQRAYLQCLAAGISAIEFVAPVNDAEFPSALGAADVLLVNERPGIAHMSAPSKLTSYFRAGKPILAATDPAGFTASELAASGAGICVAADRPDLLLNEAIRLGNDQHLAQRLGDAGGQYCDVLLSEVEALDRYERWIVELSQKR